MSEDELLPTVKKEGIKRKITEGDYDPGSPTSESEVSAKKPFLDQDAEKDKEKVEKPKKLPELDKYWKAVNDDPTDFTGWTYLLQYVDQEVSFSTISSFFILIFSGVDYDRLKKERKLSLLFCFQLIIFVIDRMTWRQPERHMMPFYPTTPIVMVIGGSMQTTRSARATRRSAKRYV